MHKSPPARRWCSGHSLELLEAEVEGSESELGSAQLVRELTVSTNFNAGGHRSCQNPSIANCFQNRRREELCLSQPPIPPARWRFDLSRFSSDPTCLVAVGWISPLFIRGDPIAKNFVVRGRWHLNPTVRTHPHQPLRAKFLMFALLPPLLAF